jgi:hypothetical protein
VAARLGLLVIVGQIPPDGAPDGGSFGPRQYTAPRRGTGVVTDAICQVAATIVNQNLREPAGCDP